MLIKGDYTDSEWHEIDRFSLGQPMFRFNEGNGIFIRGQVSVPNRAMTGGQDTLSCVTDLRTGKVELVTTGQYKYKAARASVVIDPVVGR